MLDPALSARCFIILDMRAGSPRSDCPHCPERSCRSCCPRRVSRGRIQRVSLERFSCPNTVSLLISTVSIKRPEEPSGNVPESAGMRISLICNSYRSISQYRSTSVPAIRGTFKLLITIVLRASNRRSWPKTKKNCKTLSYSTVRNSAFR